MNNEKVTRIASFSEDVTGGNPAGVWVGAESLPDASR